ncbi:spore coat protein F [Cytobacillus firmus DS1]|uniref:Spore coat protein F n=1 Tax=Cytobacillus firmus DS1 TaxID=1307436 RepID=W7L6N4_CYTFI|nr:spore coat protein F [Cytobacillus firmus DS1]
MGDDVAWIEFGFSGEVTELMLKKGWIYPRDIGKQIELDIKSADMAITIGNMELFPANTDRLGTFATPEKSLSCIVPLIPELLESTVPHPFQAIFLNRYQSRCL